MNPNLIFDLLELAIILAHTQVDSGDPKETLLDIVQKAVQAYEDHTGNILDPLLINAEDPV